MISESDQIIALTDPILVTGGSGFIGGRVVANLLERGFKHVRCLVRPSADLSAFQQLQTDGAKPELLHGNLLSRADCSSATKDVAVIYHLAAGTGEKSFPDAFMNSVVTTRNLLDGVVENRCLKRFVSISSFAVYSNRNKPRKSVLDEECPLEERPHLRGEAYCYAKQKQDELILDYAKRFNLSYVLLRPGVVYGPGKSSISGRIGRNLGMFLHLGGSNRIPFTYVDNCAEAIVLSGLVKGADREVFNIVDDDLPTSRWFLREYKKRVKSFHSLYVPRLFSYVLCSMWEKYSSWSQGQLPPVLNRLAWHAYWKGSSYSNEKLKSRLGWRQRVSTSEGMHRYFQSCQAPVNA